MPNSQFRHINSLNSELIIELTASDPDGYLLSFSVETSGDATVNIENDNLSLTSHAHVEDLFTAFMKNFPNLKSRNIIKYIGGVVKDKNGKLSFQPAPTKSLGVSSDPDMSWQILAEEKNNFINDYHLSSSILTLSTGHYFNVTVVKKKDKVYVVLLDSMNSSFKGEREEQVRYLLENLAL